MLLEISLVLLLALLVLILATVISRRKRKDGLLVPDWKPDTIYLAQVSSLSSIYALRIIPYLHYLHCLHCVPAPLPVPAVPRREVHLPLLPEAGDLAAPGQHPLHQRLHTQVNMMGCSGH